MISLGADDHIIGVRQMKILQLDPLLSVALQVKLVDVGNAFFVDEQAISDFRSTIKSTVDAK